LRQNLAQLAAELGDLSQSEIVGLEPFETELIDISSPDVQSGNGREINVQGGIGLAIQFLPPNPLPTPAIGDVKIYINRPDGFSVDPRIDKILPVWPIVKLFVKAKQGATGGVRIRIFKDPTFLFTVSPESALMGEVKVQNAAGVTINPATEDTLAGGVKVKNAAGTVINPATEDTLAGGIKVKNAAGTVINPATEDTLAGGIKVKNAAGTVINPATEDTLAGGIKIKNSAGTVINPATNELFQNRSSGYSKQYSVGTTVITGDNQAVPDGKAIAIWADPDNTAEVAFTFDGTTNPVVGTHAGLKPGQGISIMLTNINKIKMVAASGTQKINIVVEI
jgi:hypothetical protein